LSIIEEEDLFVPPLDIQLVFQPGLIDSLLSYANGLVGAVGSLAASIYDTLAEIYGFELIVDAAQFGFDLSSNIASSIVDFVVSDFNNLREANYSVFWAGALTAFDAIGQVAGTENLANAWEGRDRAGNQLSGARRAFEFGLYGVNVAAIVIPVAKGVSAAKLATKGAGAAAAASTLSAGQASSLSKFIKKLPSAAEETVVHNLPGGGKAFAANVPGKVPGSFAQYLKQVGPDGKTILYYKTTFNPLGGIVHVKDKLDGFTWLWETLLP
jgi:hypothetical protein